MRYVAWEFKEIIEKKRHAAHCPHAGKRLTRTNAKYYVPKSKHKLVHKIVQWMELAQVRGHVKLETVQYTTRACDHCAPYARSTQYAVIVSAGPDDKHLCKLGEIALSEVEL